VPQIWKALPDIERKLMTIDLPSAPVLLPAHLDALVQTSPKPAEEPSIDLFLHGPQRGNADIQVVWRADLDRVSPELWSDIVGMCPPVSAEAMPIRACSRLCKPFEKSAAPGLAYWDRTRWGAAR